MSETMMKGRTEGSSVAPAGASESGGVINTIRQAQAASGIQKVHAVLGGFHLVPPLDDDYFRQIITALKEINPDYLMPAHCTGEPFYDMVRRDMPGKVFQSNVGTLYSFTA